MCEWAREREKKRVHAAKIRNTCDTSRLETVTKHTRTFTKHLPHTHTPATLTHTHTHKHAKRQVKQWREKVKECSDPIWSYFLYTYTYKEEAEVGRTTETKTMKEKIHVAKQWRMRWGKPNRKKSASLWKKSRYLHVIYYIKEKQNEKNIEKMVVKEDENTIYIHWDERLWNMRWKCTGAWGENSEGSISVFFFLLNYANLE